MGNTALRILILVFRIPQKPLKHYDREIHESDILKYCVKHDRIHAYKVPKFMITEEKFSCHEKYIEIHKYSHHYSETLEFNAYQIEIESNRIESKRTESNRIENQKKFPYA